MKTIALALVAASALAAGCGSSAMPADRMANAQASIRGAEVVGARNDPTAALHLRLAQENYDKAQKMAKDGDTDRAKLVLQRAEADAELALIIAKERVERTEANRAMEQSKPAPMPAPVPEPQLQSPNQGQPQIQTPNQPVRPITP
jgi:uncharacterized protein DUF4398